MKQTNKSLKAQRLELQVAFPELSPIELAQVLAGVTTASNQALAPKKLKPLTINAIIKVLRKRLLDVELQRPRARISQDGTIRMKDMSTYRTYNTNWKRLEKSYGKLPITQFTEDLALEFCSNAMKLALRTHLSNAKSRVAKGLPAKDETGHHAYNRALDTLSTVIKYALKNGAISISPLADIKRKPISETDRHGLSETQVEAIMSTALNGGNDPELDYIMLWTILETACRSGGLLKLQLQDLDQSALLVRFHEKSGKSRKQPVSQALMDSLTYLSRSRGSFEPTDPVFRYKPKCDCFSKKTTSVSTTCVHGHPKNPSRTLTTRRFERLWERIGKQLNWVAEKQISNHWLRHTTLTWVERATSSSSIVAKYAGHGPATVTAGYTTARREEITAVHNQLFGGQ